VVIHDWFHLCTLVVEPWLWLWHFHALKKSKHSYVLQKTVSLEHKTFSFCCRIMVSGKLGPSFEPHTKFPP